MKTNLYHSQYYKTPQWSHWSLKVVSNMMRLRRHTEKRPDSSVTRPSGYAPLFLPRHNPQALTVLYLGVTGRHIHVGRAGMQNNKPRHRRATHRSKRAQPEHSKGTAKHSQNRAKGCKKKHRLPLSPLPPPPITDDIAAN